MDEILATVKLFAGNFNPRGYMFCDGQQLQINDYQALFSILGTQYGGDGRTTFKLPNLNKDRESNQPKYIICVEGVYPQRY